MNAERSERRWQQGGFSLLELLVVVAVLGVLVGVGGMILTNLLGGLRMDRAATVVGETLRRIGDDARQGSRRYTLDESQLATDPAVMVWQAGGGGPRRETLPPGATISSVTKQVAGTPVEFTGRGLPVQSVTFEVSLGSRSRQVILLPTGLVVRR